MCGIFGSFTGTGGRNRIDSARVLQELSSRGPDGRGEWASPSGAALLLHSRLALNDAARGRQPVVNEDGSVVAAVNGELYGYKEIRRELESRGHAFASDSDSEILVHLYEELGTDCLGRLRGEFAFLLWDERSQLAFAARDRFGIKPLCYWFSEGRLLAASSARALFAAGVDPAWDFESLFQSSSLQYTLPGRTYFRGVRQLEPGHLMVLENSRLRTEQYWDLDYPVQEPSGEDPDKIASCIAKALRGAVKDRLDADFPPALYLSGGIDSSAVAGIARDCGSMSPAFSVSFTGSAYDEADVARSTATHLGIELEILELGARELIDAMPEAVRSSEGLAINAHLPAKFLLSRAVRAAGYKAVLSGEGADEIFMGYPHLRQDLLAERFERRGNSASAGLMMSDGSPSLPVDAPLARLGYVPNFLLAKAQLGWRMRSLMSRELLRELADRDPLGELLDACDAEAKLAGRAPIYGAAYLWNKTALATYILKTLGDGTEMANGIEGRLPFLDCAVVAAAARAPLGLKIREGVEKHIMREAVKPWVTPEIYRRQKHPFLAPPLAGRFAVELDLGSSDLPACLDRAAVRGLISRLPAMSEEEKKLWDPAIMLAVSIACLGKAFGL